MRTSPHGRLDSMFLERWSPRAFSTEPLDDETVATLFEAARWSPSCFNEQPWRFVYAVTEAARAAFTEALTPGNQRWAGRAPLLAFLFARQRFRHNDNPNRLGQFDAGAAWLSLALQAEKLGLRAHGMAGFDVERAHALTGVDPSHYTAMCAIAIGYQGDPADLPEDLREREQPSDRLALEEVVFEERMV